MLSVGIGAITVATGGDWSPAFRLGINNVLVPQLLGCSFQKAIHFTASSHQNAGFGIIFRGWPPSAPNTQPGLWPGVGHKRLGVGTQTLVPLNFSAVVAPLSVGVRRLNRLKIDVRREALWDHNVMYMPGVWRLTLWSVSDVFSVLFMRRLQRLQLPHCNAWYTRSEWIAPIHQSANTMNVYYVQG